MQNAQARLISSPREAIALEATGFATRRRGQPPRSMIGRGMTFDPLMVAAARKAQP
jgi:hypothetical protein